MGLLFLGSWIQSRLPDWQVRLVEANWEKPLEVLLREPWDAIGISAMTPQYEEAHRLTMELKRHKVSCPVIVGGVHISTCPASLRPEFDLAIAGEGELRLQDYLSRGHTAAQYHSLDLNDPEYPDLDLSLLNPNSWKKRLTRFWGVCVDGMLLTARGCPFSCQFCATSVFWAGYRWHRPDWVIRQMQRLAEKGVDHLVIWDDLFTVNKRRLREIAEGFERAGLVSQIKQMAVQGRADVMDDEVCDCLRRMNVVKVSFGWESGSDRVVRYLKGGHASVAENDRSVRICRQHGLQPGGSFVLGSPGETLGEMLQTVRWIIRHWFVVTWVYPFAAVPFPGTPFWEVAKARGVVSDGMNFEVVLMHAVSTGRALLIDVPRWQFWLVWALAQASLWPFKIRTAWRMAWSSIRPNRTRLGVSPHY